MSTPEATVQPADFDKQVAETFSPKREMDDQIMAFWYKTNWTDILGPAPTMISLLGRLLQLGITVDFPLQIPAKVEHIKYDRFLPSVQQLANQGTVALTKSKSDMENISANSQNILDRIKDIVMVLVDGNEETIPQDLGPVLESLKSSSQSNLNAAKEMKDQWFSVLLLAHELQEVCISTKGKDDEQLRQAELQKNYLIAVRDNEKKNADWAKKYLDTSEEALRKSHEIMEKSLKDIPSGLEIAAMGLAQGVVNAAQTGVEALIHRQCFQDQMENIAVDVAADVLTGRRGERGHHSRPDSGKDTPSTPSGTQPNADPSAKPEVGPSSKPEVKPEVKPTPPAPAGHPDDLGHYAAEPIATGFSQLKHLVTGGSGAGGVRWELVDGEQVGGSAAIRVVFHTYAEEKYGTKAHNLAKSGEDSCDRLDKLKVNHDLDAIKAIVDDVLKLEKESREYSIETQATPGVLHNSNLLLTNGTIQTPDGSSWGKILVETSQMRVQYAQSYLEASGQMHKEAVNVFLDTNRKLAEFNSQLEKLTKDKIEWELVAKMLAQAVKFLSVLNDCLQKIVSYFSTIDVIVQQASGTTIKFLVDLLQNPAKDVQHGLFRPSNVGKQLIYNQTIAAKKITLVTKQISEIYVELHNNHVEKGVSLLAMMTKDIGDKSKAAILEETGKELDKWAEESQKGMGELITQRSKIFEDQLQARIEEIKTSCAQILPHNDEIQQSINKVKTKVVATETESSKIRQGRLHGLLE